jgi:thiol-disulfide isomerase/thioredoxin
MAGKRLKIDGVHHQEVGLEIFTPAQRSPGYARAFAFLLFSIAFTMLTDKAFALSPEDADAIPHVGKKARENFVLYQYAGNNRAFAIAPGGAWGWQADEASEDAAVNGALQACQSNTRQKCVLYALNDRIVFDKAKWPTLWGPYTAATLAASAPVGTAIGERFPDLVWFDEARKPVTLSHLRGKVVFLHFWGSWCPPCMREFPSLELLRAEIGKKLFTDVEMVLLQMREPFSQSRNWVEEYGFTSLPLYDSGVADSDTSTLSLSNGGVINDREIARVFPSTYVLDRNGVVIFSRHGPVTGWLEYLPFFEHAVEVTATQKKLSVPTTLGPQP